MAHQLNERERRVLEAVIQSYVETAEPAGSRMIARRFGLGVSPATIRNTMSDLEEKGFLLHPHTSAGRIPTDMAYRVYVDSLMRVTPINEIERGRLFEELSRHGHRHRGDPSSRCAGAWHSDARAGRRARTSSRGSDAAQSRAHSHERGASATRDAPRWWCGAERLRGGARGDRGEGVGRGLARAQRAPFGTHPAARSVAISRRGCVTAVLRRT